MLLNITAARSKQIQVIFTNPTSLPAIHPTPSSLHPLLEPDKYCSRQAIGTWHRAIHGPGE
jgi:hypothetical protein